MPFLPPQPIPTPHFLAEIAFVGIANSIDQVTGLPIDFRPTGAITAGSEGTGRVTMTTSVEKEVKVRLLSLGREISVPDTVTVPSGQSNSLPFQMTAENGDSPITVVAIYEAFFGPSTAAMQIDVFPLK